MKSQLNILNELGNSIVFETFSTEGTVSIVAGGYVVFIAEKDGSIRVVRDSLKRLGFEEIFLCGKGCDVSFEQ